MAIENFYIWLLVLSISTSNFHKNSVKIEDNDYEHYVSVKLDNQGDSSREFSRYGPWTLKWWHAPCLLTSQIFRSPLNTRLMSVPLLYLHSCVITIVHTNVSMVSAFLVEYEMFQQNIALKHVSMYFF